MKIVDCHQYSAEWWAARLGVPTASEFHRIITPAKWEYAKGASTYMVELIADRYDPFYGRKEEYVSRAMVNGSLMEPEARRWYEFTRGVEVEQVGFCLTDDGRFGCSPDSLVGDDGGLECKSPIYKTQVQWLLRDRVPPEHLAQCHGFLAVTGRSWCDFVSYCPPLPSLLHRVERDDKTERLIEALDKFHAEYRKATARIESLQAPPPPPRVVEVEGFSYEEDFYEPSPF